MPFERLVLRSAAVAATLFVTAPAFAADPTGVWVNDTGRGAIEIKQCGNKLCGHVVWVKDTSDTEGCGRQIIGEMVNAGGGTWGGDGAWVYSPEKKKKYNVEVTPLSDGTLKVKGYAGISFLSKTMIWTKAPADLVRCSEQQAAVKPSSPEQPAAAPAPQDKAPSAGAPPVDKAAPAPSSGPDVAENEGEGDSVDIEGLAGDVFTRKDGKCKVDTPWVKLDFDCKDKGEEPDQK